MELYKLLEKQGMPLPEFPEKTYWKRNDPGILEDRINKFNDLMRALLCK